MDKTIKKKIFAMLNELNEIDKAMDWAKEVGLTIKEMQEALRDFATNNDVKENKKEN